MAGFHPVGEWHCEQPLVIPGMCPVGVLWHDSQVLGLPAYRPSAWHDAHATARCLPASGNAVWSKLAGFHPFGEWHRLHVRDVGR